MPWERFAEGRLCDTFISTTRVCKLRLQTASDTGENFKLASRPPGCRLGASPLAAATSRRGAASPSRPLRDALGRARLRAHARPVPSARARPRLELAFGRRRHLRSRTRRRRVFARGIRRGESTRRARASLLAGGMSAINVTSVQVLVRPALVPPRTRLRGPSFVPRAAILRGAAIVVARARCPEARLPDPPRRALTLAPRARATAARPRRRLLAAG